MNEERSRNLADWQGDAVRALAFLTRVPLPQPAAEPGALARAAWAFPLVGVLVGLAGGAVFALGERFDLPILAMALLTVMATALVTGALHEDGLADTVDGFGGGADRERTLAIMRDSRIGTFGVLALVFSVGLRVAALAAFADTQVAVAGLVAAHALSRGFLPVIMAALNPARTDGLGADAGRPSTAVAAAAALIGLAIAVAALGFSRGLAASLLAAIAVAGFAWLAQRRIGGYTGDVLGGAQQIGEIVVLLAVAT